MVISFVVVGFGINLFWSFEEKNEKRKTRLALGHNNREKRIS